MTSNITGYYAIELLNFSVVKTVELYNVRNKSERAVVRSSLYQPKYIYFFNLRDTGSVLTVCSATSRQ